MDPVPDLIQIKSAGDRTRDLMISSQTCQPLDQRGGLFSNVYFSKHPVDDISLKTRTLPGISCYDTSYLLRRIEM